MGKTHKSFAGHLSRDITLITSILFLVAILAIAWYSLRIVGEQAGKNAQLVLRSTINGVEMTLREAELSTRNNVWSVVENRHNENRLFEVTREIVASNENVIGSAAAFAPGAFDGRHWFCAYSYETPEGKVRSFQSGRSSYDYPLMPWFAEPYASGEACWSEPYFDEGGGETAMITYSIPVQDGRGRTFAVLTADISLERLTDSLTAIQSYPNAHTFILGSDGTFISHRDRGNILQKTIFEFAAGLQGRASRELTRVAEEMTAGHSGYSIHYREERLGAGFIVYGPLSNGWSVGVVCPYQDVYGKQTEMLIVLIVDAILGLLGLFFLCRSIIRRKSRPLSLFSKAALSIAQGNFHTEIPEVPYQDEISTLRDSLQYMQYSLAKYIADLKASTAQNERYENELNIAREIQMQMLSTDFPKDPRVGLHAVVNPAREVGGDLYDFCIRDNILYFAIGDVSGKGMAAALFMAMTRAAFRFLAGLKFPMDEIVSQINNSVSEGNLRNMFVTFFAGSIDLTTGEMQYCNAGHNPLILVSPEGKAEFLHPKANIACGIMPDFRYEKETLRLRRGSRLLLYTDGVTEAERGDLAQYGEARLLEWAQGPMQKVIAAETDPLRREESALENLLFSLHGFTGDADQNDDITAMIITLK